MKMQREASFGPYYFSFEKHAVMPLSVFFSCRYQSFSHFLSLEGNPDFLYVFLKGFFSSPDQQPR